MLRVVREKKEIEPRSFAVKWLAHSLPEGTRWSSLVYKIIVRRFIGQSFEDIVDEHALSVLDEIARDDPSLTDGAFKMLTTILSQSEHSI